MRVPACSSSAPVLMASGAALCVAIAARAASPACTPEAPPATVPATLLRALATDRSLESASGLRAELRALWADRQPVPGPPWDADCEEANRDSAATPGLIRHALADGSWLIQFACAQGAYQGSFWAAQVWALPSAPGGPAGRAAVLCWPVPSERAGGAAPGIELSDQVLLWGELGTVAPAPATSATVEIVNRFRAIGDCGIRSHYAVERGTTRLVGLAAALTCPEAPPAAPSGPADWPTAPLPDR